MYLRLWSVNYYLQVVPWYWSWASSQQASPKNRVSGVDHPVLILVWWHVFLCVIIWFKSYRLCCACSLIVKQLSSLLYVTRQRYWERWVFYFLYHAIFSCPNYFSYTHADPPWISGSYFERRYSEGTTITAWLRNWTCSFFSSSCLTLLQTILRFTGTSSIKKE